MQKKLKSKGEDEKMIYEYKLYGTGESPVSKDITFKGTYNPYAKDPKKTVTMEFIRKNDTLKVELHTHGAYDPQPANQSAKSAVYIGDSTKDVRGTGNGMGIIIVNLRNGGVVSDKDLTKHLKDLPANHAIIATTEYACHQYWKDCRQALREYNFSFWDIKQYESRNYGDKSFIVGNSYLNKWTRRLAGSYCYTEAVYAAQYEMAQIAMDVLSRCVIEFMGEVYQWDSRTRVEQCHDACKFLRTMQVNDRHKWGRSRHTVERWSINDR